MRRFFTLALMLVMLIPAFAQKRDKTLTIEVTAPSGAAVTDATIDLQHTDYSLTYGTLTLNSEGKVVVKVYAGNHKLEVSKAGYVTSVKTFAVNEDMTVSVQLEEETTLPFSLQTIVTHNAQTGLNDVLLTWNKEAPVFYDDFESYDDFAIRFGDWTGIDGDGLMTAPLVGEYLNRGVMQYAQIMNPLTVSPPWWYDYPILRPYSGQQYVGFVRTYSGQANDDWLITPVVTPGNKNVFAFMAKAADVYKEKFQVFVTTKLDNPTQNDFVMLNAGNYETADYRGWREFSYDLSRYAGQDIKLAIRYISEAANGGAFMLMVDDVYVGQDIPTANVAKKRARRVAKSPMNPNESFNIYFNGTKVGTTDGYEYLFPDLPSGTYTLGVQAVYPSSETPIVETTVNIVDLYANVTFNVSTNNGQAVDSTTVELTDKASTQVYTAVIENGVAVFPSLPLGDYLVGVTADHFEVYDSEVSITGDQTIDIVLQERIVDPYNITADVSQGDAVVKWNQNISFNDSFEDYPDFATGTFGQWHTYDLDQHPVYPIALGSMTNIIHFPGSGTAEAPTAIAPMVWNPWKTTPPMLPSDPAVQAPTGDKTIIFFSPQRNGANKWLISPELTIRENFVCRFTAKAYAEYTESMQVCVFTEGYDPNTATYEQASSIDQLTSGAWTIYETDLSKYAGQKVRIGIHYTSFDAFFAQIDDFYVGNGDEEGSAIDVGFIVNYEVQLDGNLMGTTVTPSYEFHNLKPGMHTVGIKAVYASGASQLVEYTFEVPPYSLRGDLNGDGLVDVSDVNIIIDMVLGKQEQDLAVADLDGNGIIDVSDVNAIIDIVLGK